MNLEQIRALIQSENPTARVDDVELYARQFLTYIEAAENIERNGTIVAHPRTGAPMENPYNKVRTAAQASMQKMKRLRKLNLLWTEARRYLDKLQRPAEETKATPAAAATRKKAKR
jgi:phage terminase small subunit